MPEPGDAHLPPAAEADPSRYQTTLGDRREAPVPCWACRRPTWALDALCDLCAPAFHQVA